MVLFHHFIEPSGVGRRICRIGGLTCRSGGSGGVVVVAVASVTVGVESS